jgi:outer membrane protein assembly factor BamB
MNSKRGFVRAALFLTFVALAACSALFPHFDSVTPLLKKPDLRPAGQPEPLWQTGIEPGKETEFVWSLPDKKLLIETVDFVGGYFDNHWAKVNRDLIMIDSDSGKILWNHPRNTLGESHSLVAADPVIVMRGKTTAEVTYHALNRETGAELWAKSFTGPASSFVISEKKQLLISTGTGSSL